MCLARQASYSLNATPQMEVREEIAKVKSSAEEQVSLLRDKSKSENALLLPFFAALGYHPFDVREVEPDYTVGLDVEEEKTVDYAIKKDGSPVMLYTLKEIGTDLDSCDPEPLLQSLEKSDALVGVLTNGIEYHFYADLASFYSVLKGETTPDRRPFLTFDVLRYESRDIEDLRRLTKPKFDAGEILSSAHRLKYKRLFRNYLRHQLENPDDEFVEFMAGQIHNGGSAKGDPGMYESPLQETLRELMGKEEEDRSTDSDSEELKGGEAGGASVGKNEELSVEENSNGGSEERLPIDEKFGQLMEK